MMKPSYRPSLLWVCIFLPSFRPASFNFVHLMGKLTADSLQDLNLKKNWSLWSSFKFLGNEILINPAWIHYVPLTQSAMVMVNMTVFVITVNGERLGKEGWVDNHLGIHYTRKTSILSIRHPFKPLFSLTACFLKSYLCALLQHLLILCQSGLFYLH